MPQYDNPPIQRVLMGVTFDHTSSNLPNYFFEKKYSKKSDIFETSITIDGKNSGKDIVNNDIVGAAYEIDSFVLNVFKNKIILEKLYHYSSYEDLEKQLKKIWLDCEELSPIAKNIDLHYSNLIDIPIDAERIEDYLTQLPPIPEKFTQSYAGLSSVISIPLAQTSALLTISQRMVQPKKPKVTSFEIDINIQKKLSSTSTDLWTEFQNQRFYKNTAFESLITDKTRELFK